MRFYDTCSLLKKLDNLFDEEIFVISSVTLNELEHIKTSTNKDPEIKYAARKLLRLLDGNLGKYYVLTFVTSMLKPMEEHMLEITNDIKILATAYDFQKYTNSDIIFVTDDLALKNIAEIFFDRDHIESVGEEEIDNYTGYKEIVMSDEEMAKFYASNDKNLYDLKINEYLNIYNKDNKLVDTQVWTGEEYRHLSYNTFQSKWFGGVKPQKNDIYQAMVADSFVNNQITMVKGPAGSGKTTLSLGYLMSLLERGKIDKIIIFCNTVATKNSAKLGFYPGTRDEKLLDSQIGNLLSSKIGSRLEVEHLIQEEKLVLLPFSDLRGYDTTGMHAGIYISEAQNLDITLMKLALQRIGEDSICIIDGDDRTQVDDINFSGSNNGMKRASKVFRGEEVYGEIELKIIHRSKIARVAEKM
jgi:PhoH-like ATPase